MERANGGALNSAEGDGGGRKNVGSPPPDTGRGRETVLTKRRKGGPSRRWFDARKRRAREVREKKITLCGAQTDEGSSGLNDGPESKICRIKRNPREDCKLFGKKRKKMFSSKTWGGAWNATETAPKMGGLFRAQGGQWGSGQKRLSA